MGPLPDSTADEATIQTFEDALAAIDAPLTLDEARALLGSFRDDDDDCFGLAWTLVHLIETAPSSPLVQLPPTGSGPWMQILWERGE